MANTAAPRWRDDPPAQSPETRRSLRTRRFVLILLVCALLLAGVVSLMMFGVRPVPHPRFVPLWVTEYQSPALPPRAFAEHDESAFRDGHYFEQAIPRGEPSLEAQPLLQRLDALRTVSRFEPVVIYLSAYSETTKDGHVEVLPGNTDPVAARNGVPFHEVLTALASCPSRHKLVLLDLVNPPTDTRIGPLVQDVPAVILSDLIKVPDASRLVLCSCSPGQAPLYSEDQRRSVFGYYVEEGLRGRAEGFNPDGKRNGQVSARELAEFVKARVERWAWRNRRAHQTPLLVGAGDDFPLLALERRQAKPPLPIPDAASYPEWLHDAWKVRERWKSDESDRLAPQLFRQLETTLLEAERDWQRGVEAEGVQDTLKSRLVRLEQKLKKAAVPSLTKPPSLALEAKGRPPKEEIVEQIQQAMAVFPAKPRDPKDKTPLAVPPELIAALAKAPTFDVLYAAFEAAVTDPNPHPDHIRFLNLLIQSRQPEPQYAETAFLQRLGELADQTATEQWPTTSVRQSLEVMRLGERSAARPQVYPLIPEALEEGAQKRYEGELFLLGGAGYAPPGEATKRFAAASEHYEAAQQRGDTVREIQRVLDEAFAVLPAYVPYLERVPEQEATWLDGVEACVRLTDLLAAAPDDLSGAAQPMTQLEDDLRRLQRPFSADALADLQARLRRHQAPPTALNEAVAILATPFLSADDREALWKATRALARRLHEETVQQDQDEAKLKPTLLEASPAETVTNQLDPREARRALQRARVSVALLRLGGLPSDELRKLDDQVQKASALPGGDSARETLAALGGALRETWTRRVPELLRPEEDVARRARLSRVYLPLDPGAVVEDTAPLPQTELLTQHQRALLTWRLDRNRYESRQLAALGLLSEKDARYYTRAAASYQTLAAAPPREPSCQISSDPPLVRLTPSTTTGAATLTFQPGATQGDAAALPVRLLLPGTNWLRVTPGLPGAADLGDNTLLSVPVRDAATLPLTIRLKPDAEGAPPQGVFVETTCGKRTAHYRLPVSLDAVSERIEILLSANPREPDGAVDELRLRPIKSRQPYYLYLRNPSSKPRKVAVQLTSGQAPLPGGEAKVDLAPNETKQVRFTAPAVPPPPATTAPAPTAPAEGTLTDLSGDLHVRLLDVEGGNKIIDVRAYRVRVASAADYTRVTNIQFIPPTERDQSLGGGKNKLTATLQATPAMTGPPAAVELVLPASRIPGFLGAKSGTMRGQLPPGGEVTLYAENLQFSDGGPEEGYAYLGVDGDERAYVFRTTFARSGGPTSPRADTLPALRLVAGRFVASGVAPPVTLEVDHPPSGATVELSLGHYQDGVFEPEEVAKRPTAKRQRIACAAASADGALLFEASTGDWVIQPETSKVVGQRVLRGRLLDKEGAPIRTVYETLTLDDAAPKGIQFVDPPKVAKKDAPLALKATAGASLSGIREVSFFLGKDAQGKPPQGATLIPAQPLDDAKTTWTATMPLRGEKSGPTEFTVQFVNRAGQTAFSTTTIDLIDADPSKVLPGRMEGVVVEGGTPIPGLKVSLRNEKNVELQTTTTDDNGAFKFEKLTPGKYLLYTSRPATKRQGSAIVDVVAEKTTTVPPIKLFLP